MSEENKQPPVIENPIVISRNGVDLTLGGFRILKGDRAGVVYQAPVVNENNLETIENWLGKVDLANQLQLDLKRIFQTIHFRSVDEETGVFNEDLFKKYAVELSTGGLKMSEINDRLDEIMQEVQDLTGGDRFDEPEVQARIKELGKQIRAFRQMREDRSKKKEKEQETAPAVVA